MWLVPLAPPRVLCARVVVVLRSTASLLFSSRYYPPTHSQRRPANQPPRAGQRQVAWFSTDRHSTCPRRWPHSWRGGASPPPLSLSLSLLYPPHDGESGAAHRRATDAAPFHHRHPATTITTPAIRTRHTGPPPRRARYSKISAAGAELLPLAAPTFKFSLLPLTPPHSLRSSPLAHWTCLPCCALPRLRPPHSHAQPTHARHVQAR